MKTLVDFRFSSNFWCSMLEKVGHWACEEKCCHCLKERKALEQDPHHMGLVSGNNTISESWSKKTSKHSPNWAGTWPHTVRAHDRQPGWLPHQPHLHRGDWITLSLLGGSSSLWLPKISTKLRLGLILPSWVCDAPWCTRHFLSWVMSQTSSWPLSPWGKMCSIEH